MRCLNPDRDLEITQELQILEDKPLFALKQEIEEKDILLELSPWVHLP